MIILYLYRAEDSQPFLQLDSPVPQTEGRIVVQASMFGEKRRVFRIIEVRHWKYYRAANFFRPTLYSLDLLVEEEEL